MCTFLTLNTASIQLIPATAIGILAIAGGTNPTAIVGTSFMSQIFALTTGLIAVKLLEKLPIFRLPKEAQSIPSQEPAVAQTSPQTAPANPSPVESMPEPAPLTRGRGIVLAAFFLFFFYLWVTLIFPDLHIGTMRLSHAPLDPKTLSDGLFSRTVKAISVLAVPFFLSFLPLYAALRRIKVYEEFIEGAKEGFNVALRIMPYLVAILAAVGMFRAAKGIDMLAYTLGPALNLIHFPTELLPLAFMRPLSGSGSFGIMAELVKTHGPDHIYSLMAGTIMGCTETTFYVVAVYFGAVGVRRARHAIPAGLLADTAGIIAAVIICRAMIGAP
jgi:spore maturation protein SpmB